MFISLIADTVAVATAKGLGLAIRRQCLTSGRQISISEQLSTFAGGFLKISAVIFPVDALAPPPVKSYSYRTLPRTLLRKKRRSKRKFLSGDDSEDGGEEEEEDGGFFGGDGPFFSGGSGGGRGGSGRGWNFDRFGGHSWDESSSSSSSDPAFDFVYEVISWIALSNCVHFAFKKVIRIVADGIGDGGREKVVAT
ncbi:uncharacterized protein LOC107433213 [Ziziphus jujuba]|uniref:Uncharacterized protein LOC107433213 n=2 Tax=Ziziphus jujuba TaxID=326968 RepID=A0A6P4BLF8_ZIZJJ|nr:uncharacterized protein LOC107433213 [Ziziphus jujuba]KAH7513402.1 hypothetical protein FEM48_Zijuj12G0196200 [Ziziphus jujuba var. spinosa]